jgi:predicted nucleotidyltransferase
MDLGHILKVLESRCAAVLPGTGVLAAYLFGSGAAGRLRKDSDLGLHLTDKPGGSDDDDRTFEFSLSAD